MVSSLLVVLFIALETVAIYLAYRATSSARTPQASIGWVVFLITAPWLAVPAYLFFGHTRFRGYVNARRNAAELVEQTLRPEAHRPDDVVATEPYVRAMERIADIPVVSGNAVDLLVDGDAAFARFFEAIDAAEDYLLVQFYILRDDGIGRALKDRLIARAQAGVNVRMLYDRIGSFRLPAGYISDLQAAGIDIRDVHALRARTNRFQINFRNHRKTLIADGRIGFIGGFNVGDEYMGRDPGFGAWRDTHCRIEGPAVAQLQLVFAEDWYWASGEILREGIRWRPDAVKAGGNALVVATGPGDVLEGGTLFFANAIEAARGRIWIASPYFVPDIDILTALKLAALRGVEVRILLPDGIDHRIVWLAAFAYFDEVRATGVQIWRYTEGFMHQKVLVVDGDMAAIGTHNLDNRSCRLNFEAALVSFDPDVVARTARMLQRDFERSYLLERPLAHQNLTRRLGAPIARLFSPML